MKIIYSDNIPDDTSSETLWLDNIPEDHKATAQRVCDKMNERLRDHQGPYFRIMQDSHVLYVWEP